MLERATVLSFLLGKTLTVQAMAATGTITYINQQLQWEDKRAPALAQAHVKQCNELIDDLTKWLGREYINLTDFQVAQVFFATRLGISELIRAPKKMEFTQAAAGEAVVSMQGTISELYYQSFGNRGANKKHIFIVPSYKVDQLARQVKQYAEGDPTFLKSGNHIYDRAIEIMRLRVYKEVKALYNIDVDRPSSKYRDNFLIFDSR